MIIRCRNFRGKSSRGWGRVWSHITSGDDDGDSRGLQHGNLIHPGRRNWARVAHVRKTEQLDRNKIKSPVSLQGGGGEERLAFN